MTLLTSPVLLRENTPPREIQTWLYPHVYYSFSKKSCPVPLDQISAILFVLAQIQLITQHNLLA